MVFNVRVAAEIATRFNSWGANPAAWPYAAIQTFVPVPSPVSACRSSRSQTATGSVLIISSAASQEISSSTCASTDSILLL